METEPPSPPSQRPRIVRKRLDLPTPFGPRMTVCSPAPTEISRPEKSGATPGTGGLIVTLAT